MLSRRQLLAASPTTLALFLALSGCKGPAVLSGPPPVSSQTQMLLQAVTAEQNLIWIYTKAMAGYSALRPTLAPLLAEHQAHLAQLTARVVEPPGKKVPDAVTAWAGGRKPKLAATADGALVQLRATEQAAVARLLDRSLLGGASPSLAQLYASVAASEATHVTTLTSQVEQSRTGS
ncbi:MAG TPA: ferritin-like domain-containing protein [Frankiaceae bacterium]|nr:ferritin-like domain-containing protein [Frankiaceae bacterium]